MNANMKNFVKKNAAKLANVIIRATQIGCATGTALWVADKVTQKSESMTLGTAAGAAAGVGVYHAYDLVVDNALDGLEVITNKIEATKAAKAAATQQAAQAAQQAAATQQALAPDAQVAPDDDEWED